MEVMNDELLKDKTTFKVGGNAKKFWIPESEKEVKECLQFIGTDPVWIISRGSNLLINDEKTFANVISMQRVDNNLNFLGNGKFYVGASNRIQKVIDTVNSKGYGGIEELVGLPALFGGIVYMNAGIGGKNNEKFCIADFICRVKVMDRSSTEILWLEKDACDFGYRHSVFQNDNYIILGAEIELYPQELSVSKKRLEDRRTYIKNNQEFGKGCFGTCFCVCNNRLLKIISRIVHYKGIRQSSRNSNWLVNTGDGTFKEAISLINRCKTLHKILFQNIELEVRIWE